MSFNLCHNLVNVHLKLIGLFFPRGLPLLVIRDFLVSRLGLFIAHLSLGFVLK